MHNVERSGGRVWVPLVFEHEISIVLMGSETTCLYSTMSTAMEVQACTGGTIIYIIKSVEAFFLIGCWSRDPGWRAVDNKTDLMGRSHIGPASI